MPNYAQKNRDLITSYRKSLDSGEENRLHNDIRRFENDMILKDVVLHEEGALESLLHNYCFYWRIPSDKLDIRSEELNIQKIAEGIVSHAPVFQETYSSPMERYKQMRAEAKARRENPETQSLFISDSEGSESKVMETYDILRAEAKARRKNAANQSLFVSDSEVSDNERPAKGPNRSSGRQARPDPESLPSISEPFMARFIYLRNNRDNSSTALFHCTKSPPPCNALLYSLVGDKGGYFECDVSEITSEKYDKDDLKRRLTENHKLQGKELGFQARFEGKGVKVEGDLRIVEAHTVEAVNPAERGVQLRDGKRSGESSMKAGMSR